MKFSMDDDIRLHASESRIMSIESKIGAICSRIRMNESRGEITSARLAEETDGRINTQNENRIVIHGLSRISGDRLAQKASATAAATEVFNTISPPGPDGKPTFLILATNYFDGERPIVECIMQSAELATQLRRRFGSASASDRKALGLSLFNSLTVGTRVRVSVMRSIGGRYQEMNPDSICSVVSYVPRPYLRLKRNQTSGFVNLHYVDAILELKPLERVEDGGLGMEDEDFT